MEEQQRQFKGIWIPKEIWLSKDLTFQEKIILVEIDSYDDGEQGCYASNKHFVKNFGIPATRVSQIIQSLQKKGWVSIDYKYEGKAITERYLHIKKPPYPLEKGMLKNEMGVCQKVKGGYVKKLKDNNTYINNTNNNNISIVEQVINYMNELAGTSFKSTTKKTRSLINARLAEGFTLDDLLDVVYFKYNEWYKRPIKFGNGVMSDTYFRPDTLFSTNFEGYLENYNRKYPAK